MSFFQETGRATNPDKTTENIEQNSVKDEIIFIPPSDWPGPGPIDLEIHDLPHESSETEWCNCFTEVQNNTELVYGHNVLWGIVDAHGKTYYSDALLDAQSVNIMRKAILNGFHNLDSHLTSAVLEVLNKGHLPLPDRLASKSAIVQKTKLSLDYDGNTFHKDDRGHYHLFCSNVDKKIVLDLHFAPKKEPIRQGNNGYTNVGRNKKDVMFYYFIPRHEVTGNIIIEGNQLEINEGIGWYDHEFGGEISKNWLDKYENESSSWNWFGFLERKIHSSVLTFEGLLKRTSKQTYSCVNQMLPRNPTFENVRDNILASPANNHYMDGVDLNVIAKNIINPVRHITDVPGKTWRSFLAVRCMDAVGGDSYRFQNLLAFAEVMHVGSLIIDDIEDNSETRRGVQTVHKTYGNAVAINSGTAAYFVAPQYLLNNSTGLTDSQRIFVYEKYFNCCRAAHCGQALDIHGLDYLMPNAVRTRDAGSVLENAIIAIHRLKTAVPVSTMAQVGVFLGGGSPKQVEGFGRYFEQVGVAFQIMDDVLNITGLPGKTLGEDISAGKVTFPIAKAMKLIDNEDERNWIWATLAKKSNDRKLILEVIGKLKKCGAVEACIETAAEMLEKGWKELDPLIPDSMSKVMIRAFGSYVLDLKH